MKKLIMAILLMLCVAGLSFAGFEGAFGLIGGLGPAAEIGLNLQLGYLSPAFVKGTEEPTRFRWGLLTDLGVGLRYKYLNDSYGTFTWMEQTSTGAIERLVSYNMYGFGFNLGLLAEFYFLPFMGIALGGGVTPGAGVGVSENFYDGPGKDVNNLFTPYARVEIPFLFRWAKLGVGFDYVFWDNEPVPPGITLPAGYRINLFMRFRGEAALAFLGMWF